MVIVAVVGAIGCGERPAGGARHDASGARPDVLTDNADAAGPGPSDTDDEAATDAETDAQVADAMGDSDQVDAASDSTETDATATDTTATDTTATDAIVTDAVIADTATGTDTPSDATETGAPADATSGDHVTTDAKLVTDAPPLSGNHIWSKRFGEAQYWDTVAVDSSDAVYFGGGLSGSFDLGAGTVGQPDDNHAFVAKFASDGAHVWSRTFLGATPNSEGQVYHLRALPSGETVLIAGFTDTMDFGSGPLHAGDFEDIVVMKLSATGSVLWTKQFGVPDWEEYVTDVAVDGDGNIVLFGTFWEPIDFGGGPLKGAGGTQETLFLVKLSPTGQPLWSKSLGTPVLWQMAGGVAVDATGDIAITGVMSGTGDFGGGPFGRTPAARGFLTLFKANGEYLSSRDLGASAPTTVAFYPGGDLIVTGGFLGAINLGGATFVSNGGSDVFLARLGADKSHKWSTAMGSGGYDNPLSQPRQIAVHPGGDITFVAAMDNPDVVGGFAGAAITRYSGDGRPVWSKYFASLRGGHIPWAVAVDSHDNTLVAGTFNDTIDFGGGPLDTPYGQDLFLVKFGP